MSEEKLDLILNEITEIKLDIQGFKQELLGFKDVQQEFKQELQGFKDVQQEFKLELQGFKDVQQEFKLELLGFKDVQQEFKQELLGFKQELLGFKQEQLSMKEEISLIKSQLDENTQLTKAVLHRQEKTDIKLEGHLLDFAKTREEVSSTNKNVTLLLENQHSIHEMLGEHDLSIRSLRKKTI